jgi:hypothetical protein
VTRALFDPIIDHPIADLFRRPPVLEIAHNAQAQLGIPYRFALRGSPPLRALMRGHSEVSCILPGESVMRPKVAFDLAENRRLVALQNARHL